MAIVAYQPMLLLMLGSFLLTSHCALGVNNTVTDTGHFDNCGDAQHAFKFEWSPKNVVAGGQVSLTADITPAADLTDGSAQITVTLSGQTLFDIDQQFTCAEISQYMPGLCPFHKGKAFHYQHAFAVPASVPMPPGAYGIKIRLSNDKKELILCAKGTINFSY